MATLLIIYLQLPVTCQYGQTPSNINQSRGAEKSSIKSIMKFKKPIIDENVKMDFETENDKNYDFY